jgi:hypothetical protein
LLACCLIVRTRMTGRLDDWIHMGFGVFFWFFFWFLAGSRYSSPCLRANPVRIHIRPQSAPKLSTTAPLPMTFQSRKLNNKQSTARQLTAKTQMQHRLDTSIQNTRKVYQPNSITKRELAFYLPCKEIEHRAVVRSAPWQTSQ